MLKRVMAAIALFLLPAALGASHPGSASALTCAERGQTPGVIESVLDGSHPNSDVWVAIAAGRVIAVEPDRGDYGTWGADIRLEVRYWLRGAGGSTLAVFDPASGSAGVGFELGHDYLVLAFQDTEHDRLATHTCSLTYELSDYERVRQLVQTYGGWMPDTALPARTTPLGLVGLGFLLVAAAMGVMSITSRRSAPRSRTTSPIRGITGVFVAALLTGCTAGSPTPPLATLGPGDVALPEYLAEVGGAPQLCGGEAFVGYPVVVHGSPDDPALTWIVFGNDGHRENLLWPPGYRARFTPSLVVLDPTGQTVAREGEYAPGGCPMLPGGTFINLPTKTRPLGVYTPSPSATPTSPSPSPAPGYVAVEGLPITVLANADADALFSEVDTCVSGAGYTVTFPASWYTNAASGDTPACSWFAPEPFNVTIRPVAVRPPPPDGVWIGIRVVDGSAGYTTITPIYLSEPVSLDGYEGSRAEFGPSTLDEIESRSEYRAYWYVIPFERVGPTFIAQTDLDLADDYPLAKAVLDRIMATIRFDG